MDRIALTRRALRLVAALFVGVLTCALPAAAQEADEAAEEATPEDRSASFRQVTGPQVEDVPGGGLLIGAYGVAWLLVVAYVWRLGALHRKTARDVEMLGLSIAAASGRSLAASRDPKGSKDDA